jgi:hypothetical protein
MTLFVTDLICPIFNWQAESQPAWSAYRSAQYFYRWQNPHQSRNMFLLWDLKIGKVTLFIDTAASHPTRWRATLLGQPSALLFSAYSTLIPTSLIVFIHYYTLYTLSSIKCGHWAYLPYFEIDRWRATLLGQPTALLFSAHSTLTPTSLIIFVHYCALYTLSSMKCGHWAYLPCFESDRWRATLLGQPTALLFSAHSTLTPTSLIVFIHYCTVWTLSSLKCGHWRRLCTIIPSWYNCNIHSLILFTLF